MQTRQRPSASSSPILIKPRSLSSPSISIPACSAFSLFLPQCPPLSLLHPLPPPRDVFLAVVFLILALGSGGEPGSVGSGTRGRDKCALATCWRAPRFLHHACEGIRPQACRVRLRCVCLQRRTELDVSTGHLNESDSVLRAGMSHQRLLPQHLLIFTIS